MQDRPQQTPQKRLDKILEGAFAGPGRSQRIFRNETASLAQLNQHQNVQRNRELTLNHVFQPSYFLSLNFGKSTSEYSIGVRKHVS